MNNALPFSVDALLPKDMAVRAENAGIAKAGLGKYRMFALAVLAGAFIAMGANYATTVWAGLAGAGVSYGIQRLLGGLVFATGLIMVIIGGSELFTGNCLIPMAWANNKVSTASMLRNWTIVYAGNFVGSVLTAFIVFLSGQHKFGGGSVGLSALSIGVAKTSLDFIPCIALGIFCNALVCMAVWMCFGARTNADKVLVILPPISAFVACGFEHCVANMYFIPVGPFHKRPRSGIFRYRGRKTEGWRSNTYLEQFYRPKPAACHYRKYHRGRAHGRPDVLVHLPSAELVRQGRPVRRRRDRPGYKVRSTESCAQLPLMSQIRLPPSFAHYKIHKAANVFAGSSGGIEIVWTSERIGSIPDRRPRCANGRRMFIFSDL